MDFLYHYTCNECKKHSTTTNPIILNIRYRNLKCRNCRGEKKQAVVERHVNREKEVKEEGDPFSLIRGDEERGLTREIKDIFNSIRDGKETGLTREVIDNLKEKLEKGNINVNILDERGCTLLMYGCKFGHEELVEILIKHGADPNVEAPDPVVGISSETIILRPPKLSTTLGPSKALVVLPAVAPVSGAPVLS